MALPRPESPKMRNKTMIFTHRAASLQIAIFTLFCGLLPMAAEEAFRPVDGFLKAGGARVWNGRDAGQELLFTKAPDGKSAWQLSWNRQRKAYAEIGFDRAIPLNSFDVLEVRLTYYSAGRNELQGCGIRITDANGETFQYSGNANDAAPGWKTISYRITPENFSECWGGDKNKKMEFPAAIIGFGAGFQADSIGPVYLGDVEYRLKQEVKGVPATARLWSFDPEKERWWVGGYDSPAGKDGLRVAARGAQEIRLDECMNINRYYENLCNVRFSAELRKGKSATVTVLFYDAKGKEFRSAPLTFTGGPEELEAAIPAVPGPIRVKAAYAQFADAPETELLLRRADVVSSKALLDAIDITLETGNPLHIVTPAKRNSFAIRLCNTAGKTIDCNGSFTFTDLVGDTFSVERKLSLSPGLPQDLRISLPEKLKFGIWYVDARFTLPGAEPVRKQRSFAYMIPAGPTPGKPDLNNSADFLYGICNATERWGYFAEKMDALAAGMVGAKVFRTGTPWGYIQRSGSSQWDFALMDRIVGTFAEQGVELQGLFGGTPRWAIDLDSPKRDDSSDTRGGKMPRLEPYRAAVRRTAERYKGQIRLWEVGNEPDHPGFASYGPESQAQLQAIAFEEARKVDPSIRVMTAGFAGVTGDSFRYQLRTLTASKGEFDIHTVHLHGPFSSFARHIDEDFRQLRARLGISELPWYPNETAIHSTGGTQKIQAETLYTKLLFARARGAIGYTWYNMRDVGFNAMDNEHNYGMLTADFYPKAVFPAYAALVNTYRGFAFERQLKTSEGEYAFLFRNGSTLAIAGWRGPSTVNSGGTYALITDAARAETIDIMGNVEPLAVESGQIFWNITHTPVTIKLYDATRVETAPVISASVSGCAVPGREVEVNLSLVNPLTEPLPLTLHIHIPGQFKARQRELKVELPPSGKLTRTFTLLCSTNAGGVFGSDYLVQVGADFGKYGATTLALAVHSAACLSADVNKAKPDFILDKRRQVRVLFDNVPNKPFWTGPSDLSAKITLGLDRDELVVRAAVEDDIHLQRQTEGPECWRDDSIQFAIQLPGRGCWELGGGHVDGGTPHKAIWISPKGADTKKALQALKLTTSRQGTVTGYEFRLPFNAFGLTARELRRGFRFNLVVNDADLPEIGREGWAEIAPGIADGNKDVDRYPFVVFID